jgi:hypothetical protein
MQKFNRKIEYIFERLRPVCILHTRNTHDPFVSAQKCSSKAETVRTLDMPAPAITFSTASHSALLVVLQAHFLGGFARYLAAPGRGAVPDRV